MMQKQKRAGGGDPDTPVEEQSEKVEAIDASEMLARLDGGIAQAKKKEKEAAKVKVAPKPKRRERVSCCGTW